MKPLSDEVKAILDNAPQWQPIETAPKDGTDIIVGFDAASVWVVHVAWWDDGLQGMDEIYDAEGVQIPNPDDIGWWSYVRGSVTQEQLDGFRMPTHWIELPDVPGLRKRKRWRGEAARPPRIPHSSDYSPQPARVSWCARRDSNP